MIVSVGETREREGRMENDCLEDQNKVFPRNKQIADLNSTPTFEKKNLVTKMDVATYISSLFQQAECMALQSFSHVINCQMSILCVVLAQSGLMSA